MTISRRPCSCALTENALILGLLGPGAFSVDAQLHGRREIVIARGAGSGTHVR
jgi:hypothetical protein